MLAVSNCFCIKLELCLILIQAGRFGGEHLTVAVDTRRPNTKNALDIANVYTALRYVRLSLFTSPHIVCGSSTTDVIYQSNH